MGITGDALLGLPAQSVMLRAVRERDSAFEGVFVFAVRTTGVFCRPTCRAKPARAENIEFFRSPADAIRDGYRPCRMCRPDDPARLAGVVQQLMDWARTSDEPIREHDLRARGIDPSTARRQFKTHTGQTFAGYQRSLRLGRAVTHLRTGASVLAAQAQAGFASASGFRSSLQAAFARSADRLRDSMVLMQSQIDTPVGPMRALASDAGVVVIDFDDRKGLPGAIERARMSTAARQPAVITPGENAHLVQLRQELTEYFAGERTMFNVACQPLGGTPFERAAWAYLADIPFGQTRSYGEQATAIGRPGAQRAVGRANGMNYLAIVIPCHRVVASTGKLTGYGGGIYRKRWLLDHERHHRDDLA